jgi:Ca2+-dependent lipid-binding protein
MTSRLRIHLKYGTGLFPYDGGVNADPNVKLQTNPAQNEIKSMSVKKNLNPHWNQQLDLRVPLAHNLALEGFVFDVGTFTDNAIGYIYIPLTDRRCLVDQQYNVGPRPQQYHSIISEEKYQGSINLKVEWLDGIPSIVTGGGTVGGGGAGGSKGGPMKSKGKKKAKAGRGAGAAKAGRGGRGAGAAKAGRGGRGAGAGGRGRGGAAAKKGKKGSGRSGVGSSMDGDEEETYAEEYVEEAVEEYVEEAVEEEYAEEAVEEEYAEAEEEYAEAEEEYAEAEEYPEEYAEEDGGEEY